MSASTSSSRRSYSRSPTKPTSPPAIFNPGQSPNYTFTRPRAPSPYMRTLLVYLDAVNARDYSSMEAVFDDALEHRILPKSMARPVLTKRQYIDYWREIMGLFAKFETQVHEIIEAGDKLTVHGSTKGKSWSGTPYSNEYILLIQYAPFDEASSSRGQLPQIRYVKEFIDSSVSLQFFREESEQKKLKEQEKLRALNGYGGANGNGNGRIH